MQKIKILIAPAHYYLDDKTGGSEYSWVAKILSGLIQHDFLDIKIITGFIKNFSDEKNIVSIKKKFGTSVFDALSFVFKNYFVSQKILRNERYDIVHHMLPFLVGVTFDLNFLLRKKRKYKLILGPLQSPHTIKSNEEFSFSQQGFNITFSQKFVQKSNSFLTGVFSSVLSFLSKKTLQRADKIIVINQHAKNLLQNFVKPEKIQIIPPGIDVSRFYFCDLKSKNSEVIEIITVGYLIQRKGIELIIQALADVAILHKNVRLRIIGDGPQRKSLETLVSRLGLENRVVFQGFISNDEIQTYYQKAHIFVSMSRSESWGQMYLEAMACGLPVISSKNVGSESIIHEGEFGYLVEQENVQALAEKMVYLIEHPDMIASFGKKARQEVEEKYDWDQVIIPQYLELYKSL